MQLIDKLADIDLLLKCWKSVYQGKTEDTRANSKGIDDISLESFQKNHYENLNIILNKLKIRKYKFQKLIRLSRTQRRKRQI